jgi:hypothetical protein
MSVQISQLPNITSTQLTSGTTASLSMPLIASVASGNVTTYQTSFSNVKTYIGNGNLSVTGNITANGGLQNTPIGNVAGQASTGSFTTITANGNVTAAGLTVNASGVFTTTVQAKGGLQNTPIGNVAGQASSGSFTTITANGNITAAALSSNASITAITTLSALGGLQNTPIGNVAGQASSGSFTTVTANGNVTASALTVNNSATIGSTLGVTGNLNVSGVNTYFAGNVGIGTTLPGSYGLLTVLSSTAGSAKISIQDTSGNASPAPLLQFGVNSSNGFNTADAARIWTTSPSSTTAALNFAAYNGGAPTTAQLTLTSGNVLVTGGGLGYGTGAGGTITQGTGRATGVTINKPTGNIILFSAAGNTTPTTFTVTNSFVANSDVIVLNQRTGTNIYLLWVSNITNGTFNITAYTTGGVTTEAPVINFAVIKGVTA